MNLNLITSWSASERNRQWCKTPPSCPPSKLGALFHFAQLDNGILDSFFYTSTKDTVRGIDALLLSRFSNQPTSTVFFLVIPLKHVDDDFLRASNRDTWCDTAAYW